MPAPRYELAICEGYEAVNEKYLDYGTAVPMAYKEGESLLNLLEFFRKYPDEKVDIDNYVNYCQMFYDYRDIFEADFFQKHQEMAERKLMEKSATCIHKNLLYIKEHYPQTTEEFLDKAEKLKTALTEASEDFLIRGNTEYPDCADSSAWLIGKARYKDKDEEKASAYEAELYGKGKKLDFRDVSISAINEIKAVISQMEEVLRKRE